MLSRIRSFESGVIAWNTEEGREILSPEIVDMMLDTLFTLQDFKATYPAIIKIETTATAQNLATIQDIEPAKQALADLALVAEQNPEVHEGQVSAKALKDHLEDVELAGEEVREASASARPKALEKERQTLAYALLTARNYVVAPFRWLKQEAKGMGMELFKPGIGRELGKAIRSGAADGAKSLAKGGVITLGAFVAYKLAGPLGGLSMFISSLRPLARKAEELREGLEEEQEEEQEKEEQQSEDDDDDMVDV